MAAAKAIEANPEMNDRAIADKTGIAPMTIRRARKSVLPNGKTDKRVGKDGKSYPATKPRLGGTPSPPLKVPYDQNVHGHVTEAEIAN
jgi:hypothetical protein